MKYNKLSLLLSLGLISAVNAQDCNTRLPNSCDPSQCDCVVNPPSTKACGCQAQQAPKPVHNPNNPNIVNKPVLNQPEQEAATKACGCQAQQAPKPAHPTVLPKPDTVPAQNVKPNGRSIAINSLDELLNDPLIKPYHDSLPSEDQAALIKMFAEIVELSNLLKSTVKMHLGEKYKDLNLNIDLAFVNRADASMQEPAPEPSNQEKDEMQALYSTLSQEEAANLMQIINKSFEKVRDLIEKWAPEQKDAINKFKEFSKAEVISIKAQIATNKPTEN